ncbi:MAG TPA: TadE family protein [Mycobacterium sp.]
MFHFIQTAPCAADRDRSRRLFGARGQSVAEFALILPVLIALVLGAIDFGRIMQARVTSESAAKAGAHWGASHLQNATQTLPPAYAWLSNPKNCGSGTGLDFEPTCNILARACAEASGLPGFWGTTPALTGAGGDAYQVCSSGSSANVCQANASQSNPFLTVTWAHNGTTFTASDAQRPVIGDTVMVTGTYCFRTFFPGPVSQVTWTSSATYTVQP